MKKMKKIVINLIVVSSFMSHFSLSHLIDEENNLNDHNIEDKQNEMTDSKSPSRQNSEPILFKDFMKQCLPVVEEQSSDITCDFETSAVFHRDFEGQCIQNGIIRLIGEFDVVTIRCKAPFHLDFDFDGFQPTEAIKVTSWKEIDLNSTKKIMSAYHIVLKIYSNTALYNLYWQNNLSKRFGQINFNNLNDTRMSRKDWKNNANYKIDDDSFTKHEYSRSGKYIVRGMFNFTNRFPLYFFFEESSQQTESLMFNNYTQIFMSQGNFLTVPCRPSHYNATVNVFRIDPLTAIQIQVTNFDYNPWTGFTFPTDDIRVNNSHLIYLESFNYTCVLRDTNSHIIFTFPPENGKAFGFDELSDQVTRNNKVTMNHEAERMTRYSDPITVNITCVIQNQYKKGVADVYLGSIGSDNPTHLRLVREFILPGFQNNSYTVHRTSKLVGESYPFELKIHHAFQTGITYCYSGSYSRMFSRIYEYAAGLNRVMYQLDFGTDYTSLPHTSPPKEVHIDLEVWQQQSSITQIIKMPISSSRNSVQLDMGQSYNFSCRIDLFTVAKTIIWDVHYKNGTITREKVDYDFSGAFSYFSITLELDIVKVSCSAPFWNNNKWRTDDLEILPMQEQENGMDIDKYLKLSLGAVGFLFVLMVIVLFISKRFRNIQGQFSKLEIEEFHHGHSSVKKDEVGFFHLPYDKQYEIDLDKFTIDYSRLLGSGEFGNVYKGSINGTNTLIAIKMVKPNVEKMYTKALLSELKIMIHLGPHPHLIGLIGACTANLRQGSVFVLLEYCSMGSLEDYLRKNSHQLQPTNIIYRQISVADEYDFSAPPVRMTVTDLYIWSLQIGQGLDYLSNKNVIHGDIATRNVLLTSNRIAKICDFGLSRRLHNYKIYSKTKNQPLPWPWLAPETLTNLIFSTLSDVWAYGITVWEIFSLGQMPYPGMNCTLDFVTKLRGGLRNLKPALASNELYNDIMKECWRFDPEDRPSFNELCFILENLLSAQNVLDSRQSVSSDSGIASSNEAGVIVGAYLPHNLAFSISSSN